MEASEDRMKKTVKMLIFLCIVVILSCGMANVFAARYYRLLEHERKIFLGLRGIDSLAATEYLHIDSPTERARYYKDFWVGNDEDRLIFEERIEIAFRQFGKYAPLSDDRVKIYVKYGPPFKREEITPQKKIAIRIDEAVKPAEIWTYKKEGLIFDFVRFARAYKQIAVTEFGERVVIPYLNEIDGDTVTLMEPYENWECGVTIGRFRQKLNLTRLEVYMTVTLEDTNDVILQRTIDIYDADDNLIEHKKELLSPRNRSGGAFYDEVNLWLEPAEYRMEVELVDIKNRRRASTTQLVDLIEYQNDAKEVSDLIPCILIDEGFTHGKFNKPVGRMIALTDPAVPVHRPFYFFAEVYNLETKNGMHQLKTTYEIYNKQKMRREIVDVMIKDHLEAGDVAYLGAEYHPMDLSPGYYIMVLRVVDLLSGTERTALNEFELKEIQ
jgi:hypothetical protein